MNRRNNTDRAQSEFFDVVIIGGGITGAGIALATAKKGWKTLLIDKYDFSYGTSSRSAKMIHGGLRYLQQLQISLVKEALNEREHLLKEYPHLVKPQPFFMPIHKSRLSKIKLGIGLSGYDYLSGESSMPKHAEVDIEEIKQKFPQLKTESIVGGFIYYDAKTNDARLTNEVIQEATELGAIAINYFECTAFHQIERKINAVQCVDNINQTQHTIKAKVIVNATGIWTDEVLHQFNKIDTKKYMMPSKGVHLVISADHLPKDCVLLLPTANGDGRFIWCMPWDDNLNVVGTTDTEYNDSIDTVRVMQEEVDYILQSVNAQLKDKQITEADIISVYAGIRPLLNDNDEKKKSNQRSRDYQIWWNNDNMLTIAGGKLTSFLSMADNCVETIQSKYKFNDTVNDEITMNSLIDTYKHKYGIKNATLIANIIQQQPNELLEQTLEKYPYSWAEIYFFIQHQSAIKIDDILTRRTLISYQMQQYDAILVEQISKILQQQLHLTEEQRLNDIKQYQEQWQLMHTWKK